MARILGLLLPLLLACDPPTAPLGGDPAAAEASAPAGWADRFALVRADLDQLEAAHTAKDKDAAVASWDQAYRQRFEPLIEELVSDRVDRHQLMAVEYAFGRLRDGLESPKSGPVQAALAHLREQLDQLEPAVSALPAPLP